MRAHYIWSAALALSFVHGAAPAQEPPGQPVTVSSEVVTSPVPSCQREGNDRLSFWQRWKLGKKKHGEGAPREAYAKPLGESLYATSRTMVGNGVAARLTLYQFDFVPCTDQLSPRGRDQLAGMVPLLTQYPFPLVIERSQGVASLDDSRKLTVLNELGRAGMPMPAERVVIGLPSAAGMTGFESQIEYRRLMQQSLNGGTPTAVTGSIMPGAGGGFSVTPSAGATTQP